MSRDMCFSFEGVTAVMRVPDGRVGRTVWFHHNQSPRLVQSGGLNMYQPAGEARLNMGRPRRQQMP